MSLFYVDDFNVGDFVNVFVMRIDAKSILVQYLSPEISDDIKQKRISISEIANEYVKYIENYVSVGKQYTAKVISVPDRENPGVSHKQLSLKHLKLPNLYKIKQKQLASNR